MRHIGMTMLHLCVLLIVGGTSVSAQEAVPPHYGEKTSKIDEYGSLPFERERQRLDGLADELRSGPGITAYIVA